MIKKQGGIHELTLVGEARAVVLALIVVMHYVLKASPLHERHPQYWLSLAL